MNPDPPSCHGGLPSTAMNLFRSSPIPLVSNPGSSLGNLARLSNFRNPSEAFFEIDILCNPRVRNLEGAMNLQTEIHEGRNRIILWEQATLSLEVARIQVERAGVLVQIQELASVNADFVIEHQNAHKNLEC